MTKPKFRVALVSDAWDRIEAIEHQPFAGPTGTELDMLLRQLGKARTDFYITHVVKEYPPKGNFGAYYEDKGRKKPSPLLVEAWDRLHTELRDIRPNVVIALGNEPLRALCQLQGIEKWRGSLVENVGGFKVVPTYHPSSLIRGGRTRDGVPIRPIMLLDFKKALREQDTPILRYVERIKHIEPSFDRVKAFLGMVLAGSKRVAIDIETEHGEISCIGIGPSHKLAMCIPFVDIGGRYWTREEERTIIQLVVELLEDKNIRKIGQNFAYDITWMEKKWDCEVRGFDFDTYVAMNCCFPEFPYSLAFMTSIFTDIPYYKDDNKEHKRVRDYRKHWNYNCNDVLATFECAQRLEEEIYFRGI